MRYGIVKFFDIVKDFGFIAQNNGGSVVSFTFDDGRAIDGSGAFSTHETLMRYPHQGDAVAYELDGDDKVPRHGMLKASPWGWAHASKEEPPLRNAERRDPSNIFFAYPWLTRRFTFGNSSVHVIDGWSRYEDVSLPGITQIYMAVIRPNEGPLDGQVRKIMRGVWSATKTLSKAAVLDASGIELCGYEAHYSTADLCAVRCIGTGNLATAATAIFWSGHPNGEGRLSIYEIAK